MPQMSAQRSGAITFMNARLDSEIGSLRIADGKIQDLDVQPRTGDVILDLDGARVLPGLLNCHDHLALNSLPPHPGARPYEHAHDWISEVDLRRRSDADFAASVSVPRDHRLLIGGIKNLLSGVTTVAHHDPMYPFLLANEFPISVLQNYGWSHSLYIDGEDKVLASHRSTPGEWPWIIHAAEGLNAAAAEEFEHLERLGCVRANTLLVHGIALDASQRHKLDHAAAGLIWCPSSNLNLFGKTADVRDLSAAGHVGLGTDSRLSGARDLLDELRVAREISGLSAAALEAMVTTDAAKLLRMGDRGSLRPGRRADLVVIPAGGVIDDVSRADLRLVMVEGTALYGDGNIAAALSPRQSWSHVLVDNVPKVLDRSIAEQLSLGSVSEPGLEIAELTWRAA
jgi:cytosine/adenosine deaminase-related metal-dependent hydrolase